jgi:hypothetical protein
VVAEVPKASPESRVNTVHAKGAECSPPFTALGGRCISEVLDTHEGPVQALTPHEENFFFSGEGGHEEEG